MSLISPGEIRRIADLAALRVPDDTLPALAGEIGRILAYVSQLEVVETGRAHQGRERSHAPGPVIQLRADEARPPEATIDLRGLAPAVEHDLVLTPKVVRLGDG